MILERIFASAAQDQVGNLPAIERPPLETSANKEKTALPPMWSITLHNDHTTFPDFVVEVLHQAFGVSETDAAGIMQTAHTSGKAKVKVTTKDLAESQLDLARAAISAAQLGEHHVNRNGSCELTFSIAPDTAG